MFLHRCRCSLIAICFNNSQKYNFLYDYKKSNQTYNRFATKKNRVKENLFFAEGEKVISELLDSDLELVHIYMTENIFESANENQKTLISPSDLKKISALSTANNCLALFKIPAKKPIVNNGLILALDDIRDPGNLGTIIRLCDWFGIMQLVCSPETVDVYNPKVVQATMGSLTRLNINYTNLENYFTNNKLPILGTFMNGDNIYKTNLPKNGIIIMGNEANGISKKLEKLVTQKISIPRFGNLQKTESQRPRT